MEDSEVIQTIWLHINLKKNINLPFLSITYHFYINKKYAKPNLLGTARYETLRLGTVL